MDFFFEETDWVWSWDLLGPHLHPWENRMKGDRQTHRHTDTWTDFATTRKNRPWGRFFKKIIDNMVEIVTGGSVINGAYPV